MSKIAAPGHAFPTITVPRVGGGTLTLGQADDWGLVVVFRGLHCPKCKDYLRELDSLIADFADLGVSVMAVSADPEDKAQAFVDEIGYQGVVGYGLSVPQMQALGVYISDPLSEAETGQPFAEPGLFVINDQGVLHVLDVSTAPWARPALTGVRDGIAFVRKVGRPVRGLHGR